MLSSRVVVKVAHKSDLVRDHFLCGKKKKVNFHHSKVPKKDQLHQESTFNKKIATFGPPGAQIHKPHLALRLLDILLMRSSFVIFGVQKKVTISYGCGCQAASLRGKTMSHFILVLCIWCSLVGCGDVE